ncbi:GNAT family N-acetyltransferase [Cytobacillus suaedae]|nr:GNAT family N-acetyltransferase [Cytobacillus suaedae]
METDIVYKLLTIEDLTNDVLLNFQRYQETNFVWFKEDDQYKVKEDYFVDYWDGEKKAQVVQSLCQCILNGGFVIGSFIGKQLIGFANVEGEFFGKNREYLELSYLHVSNEHRKFGVGRKLFEKCSIEAKKKGAKKLYIAAHPSVETQAFYQKVGCTYAVEINQEILEKEPLDIQMEFEL